MMERMGSILLLIVLAGCRSVECLTTPVALPTSTSWVSEEWIGVPPSPTRGTPTDHAATLVALATPAGTVSASGGTVELPTQSTLTPGPPWNLAGIVEVPHHLFDPLAWFKMRLSPDGEMLIGFERIYPDGYGGLVLADVATWEARQLIPNDEDIEMNDLFWSPDGRTIGFVEQRTNMPDSITLLEFQTGERRSFAQGDVAAWSPDGRSIFIFEQIGHMKESSLFTLRIVDVETGEEEEILQHEGILTWDVGLAWSPDGRSIALSWQDPPEFEPMLYLLDLETRELLPMMQKPYRILRILGWTADGEWLAVDFHLSEGGGTTWFVRRDAACWTKLSELARMEWLAFSGQSAKAVTVQDRYYFIDLREAYGPDFPQGVLSCSDDTIDAPFE